MEFTVVFFKPDAIEKNIHTKVLNRFVTHGLEVIMYKYDIMTEEQHDEHYVHIMVYDFYEDMKKYITGSPMMFVVLKGDDAISKVRAMIGPTRGAPAGTIRGDFGSDGFRNLIHASDSHESANKELIRFFY